MLIQCWTGRPRNTVTNTDKPNDLGELLHHIVHAQAVAARAVDVGLEHQLYLPPIEYVDPADQALMAFLFEKLRVDGVFITIPEPSTFALLLGGLLLGGAARRRRRAA